MNTKIFLAMALTVVSVNASAENSNFEGIYIGGSAHILASDGQLKVSELPLADTDFSSKDNTTGLGVNLGYGTVNGAFYVGIEAGLRNNIGKAEGSVLGTSIKADGKQAWDVTVLPGYLINETTLIYGRIGITSVSVDSEATISGTTITGTDDFNGLVCGLGLQKALAKNLSAKIEYTHASVSKSFKELGGYKIEADSAGVSLGLQYNF